MSVEEPSVIDLIGVDARSGNVVLTISDHLEWADGEHLLQLQDKLNTYLRFIESGQLIERHPEAMGRTAEIAVVFKHAPDRLGETFLSRTSTLISVTRIILTYRVLSDQDTDKTSVDRLTGG